jgi:hypothetical protein
LTASLRADFTSDKRVYVAHDLTNVRALQEDEDAKYKRLNLAIGKPFMKRNEGRTDVGLDPIPEWDTEDAVPPQPAMPVQPMDGNDPDANQDDTPAKLMTDLDKWRRKALKAFAAHDRGRLLEDFTLSVIPEPERRMILELLEAAQSEEDIKRIFGYERS